jgi:siroheme synthase (precorrin-2 oxidase/ferrochelatase)
MKKRVFVKFKNGDVITRKFKSVMVTGDNVVIVFPFGKRETEKYIQAKYVREVVVE